VGGGIGGARGRGEGRVWVCDGHLAEAGGELGGNVGWVCEQLVMGKVFPRGRVPDPSYLTGEPGRVLEAAAVVVFGLVMLRRGRRVLLLGEALRLAHGLETCARLHGRLWKRMRPLFGRLGLSGDCRGS